MSWTIVFSRDALKDKERIKQAGFAPRVVRILKLIAENPFANSPGYEKLVGDMKGTISRRINLHHRLVYRVDKENKRVIVLAMWGHYE